MDVKMVLLAGCCVIASPQAAMAQRAILPHGDPTVESGDDAGRREDIRDEHLKQQGQGPNYRIDGVPQTPPRPAESHQDEGSERQETGLSDPTVNPGQAAGMRVIHGEVLRPEDRGYVVRDRQGREVHLSIDEGTTGDTDLKPGDLINGRMTPQGRAIVIRKGEAEPGR